MVELNDSIVAIEHLLMPFEDFTGVTKDCMDVSEVAFGGGKDDLFRGDTGDGDPIILNNFTLLFSSFKQHVFLKAKLLYNSVLSFPHSLTNSLTNSLFTSVTLFKQ